MATTFVTLSRAAPGPPRGFWINDGLLELSLRLLALHLPEPADSGEHAATPAIRDRWLLASRGYFVGCIPHAMEEACADEAGRRAVRSAIDSLLAALGKSDVPLDAGTLNLLGVEGGEFCAALERWRLRDIAHALLDLLDGKIHATAAQMDIQPGSRPYVRAAPCPGPRFLRQGRTPGSLRRTPDRHSP